MARFVIAAEKGPDCNDLARSHLFVNKSLFFVQSEGFQGTGELLLSAWQSY